MSNKTQNEQDLEKFVKKVMDDNKQNLLDLSADEDLSIAIMNLISIEEHFFFTANKTKNNKYYDLLAEVRELRKNLLKRIIKEYEGEVWCISKHLLASSMRLMEYGTKLQGLNRKEEAQKIFKNAYQLYTMFWGLNLKVISTDNIKKIDENALNVEDTEPKSKNAFAKLGDSLQKILDCCIE